MTRPWTSTEVRAPPDARAFTFANSSTLPHRNPILVNVTVRCATC